MTDRRDSPRETLSAPVILRSGSATLSGTLCDVSASGARLRMAQPGFLAREGLLSSSIFLEAVPARIVWRRRSEVGLRFLTRAVRRDEEVSRARPRAGAAGGAWAARR